MQPEHHADHLIREGFGKYFAELPDHLGSEVFKTTRKRLRGNGLGDVDHAQEVFDRALIKCLDFLSKNGSEGIRNPRAWFFSVARNEATHYERELAHFDTGSVLSVIEGETDLLDATIYNPENVNAVFQEALQKLSPRHRQLIELDMVRRLSPPEIEKEMEIQSHAYFLKLKSQAFSALQAAVRIIFEKGVSSLIGL